MKRKFYLERLVIILGLLLSGIFCCLPTASQAAEDLVRVRYAGSINPVVAEFLRKEIATANQGGAAAFLLQLDTPGGLDTAMRTIIQALLGSEAPTIVQVYPAGARAASAGALITLAADFAVMAPGTNIGAAHPVSIGAPGGDDDGGKNVMQEKVLNDAVAYARSIAEQRGRNADWAERIVRESHSESASQALEKGVVDLLATEIPELIEHLDGRTYRRGGSERILQLGEVHVVEREMDWRQQLLNALSNPNVAYLLMMLGIVGIFFEISQPGVILPGVIGTLAILLALFAFQALPVNFVGVALILLGIVLFVLEVKVTSYGMLSLGGIIAFAFGSMMLLETDNPAIQISPAVIAATVLLSSTLIIGCMIFVMRAQRGRIHGGKEGMPGRRGVAVNDFDGRGRIFISGEYWDAETDVPIREGEGVEVVSMEGNLLLKVRPLEKRPVSDPEKQK
ncbi:MAG: serine protease [Desulfuromonas sp.]|nr:MAG: serine protease [Desulfuromonas sp.]